MKYYINTVIDVFVAYFKGQGLVVLILCILYAAALALIGVKFGILIGILVGLLSIIPYLGFTAGIILSVIIAAVQFRDISHVLLVILAFGIIQILESFVITPKVMGKSIGINPVAALVLLILGGLAFGPLGMIVAIPLAGVLLKIYKDKILPLEQEPKN